MSSYMRSEREVATRPELVKFIVAVLFAAMTSLLFMRLVPAMHSTGSSLRMTRSFVAVHYGGIGMQYAAPPPNRMATA